MVNLLGRINLPFNFANKLGILRQKTEVDNMNDNTPGIDFNITVQRPESLGGGSFSTFLTWDDTVFINLA